MEEHVDLSKIAGALAKSKQFMVKEGEISNTGQVSNRNFDPNAEKPLPEMGMYQSKNTGTSNASAEAIRNSKLPPEIRESFANNPIDLNFDPLKDGGLDQLAEDINKMAGIETEQPQQINEVINPNKLVGLNETEVRKIVKDELMSFFSRDMVKMVAEQVVSRIKFKKKKAQ